MQPFVDLRGGGVSRMQTSEFFKNITRTHSPWKISYNLCFLEKDTLVAEMFGVGDFCLEIRVQAFLDLRC